MIKGWRLGLAMPACLAFACGGIAVDDEESVHEKEDSTESAATAGWEILARNLQSTHPLKNNLAGVVEVDAPDTARKFQIRFARISMERSYDFLVVQDENGTELERITGAHRGYVTRVIHTRKARILLETDSSVQSWGYAIDEIRWRGCKREAPLANASLTAASSCTDLRDEIRDLAIAEVRRRFSEGHFGGPWIRRTLDATTAQPQGTPTAPAHSETNVQVQGVDEADIVKTDGNFTYTIAGHQLRVYKTWPAAETALVHAIAIEGYPKDLFLSGGRLVVFSGVQGDRFVGPIGPGGPGIFRMMPIWWSPEAYTKVTVFDVTGAAPVVQSETLVAGQYLSARRIDDSVRLVLQRQLEWPQITYSPQNAQWNTPEWDREIDTLEADAIRVVRDRALADWLPESWRIVNGQRVPLPVDCTSYHVQPQGTDLGLTSVVTLDLAQPVPSIQDTSLLVSSREIYQSIENLYVTTDHHWSCWEDAGKNGQYTYVHKLDVSDPSRTTYSASGGFVGSILDQFSLDEHGDYLRVASTNQRWDAPTPAEQSVSRVYVLGETMQGRLDIVGQTPDMAPGERIFSSRFIADRGFVVTFRQVDPLFALDLTDPRNPRIAGEIKIPGFSTYLHVLDANHLLAIGNDFDDMGNTRNGVAISIFDVSRLAQPVLRHKSLVGTPQGGSEALYDHHAFTVYTEPGQTDPALAIPFTDWTKSADDPNYWGDFKSTLKVFRVSPRGIMELGEVDSSALYQQNASNDWGWWYRPNVRRGVFVDRYVYAVTDAGIRVAPIATPGNVIASVIAPPQFEQPAPPVVKITGTAEARPSLAIPDNAAAGVSATLQIAEEIEIESLSVELDIGHTYRGDLTVTLFHDGVSETIHNKTGGSADDVKGTFNADRFKRVNAKGTWTLTIADTARLDTGTLRFWKITATGKAISGTPAPVAVDRSYTNASRAAIPDANAAGMSSEIQVPEGIKIGTLRVQVKVKHSYRGDLKIAIEHNGTQVVLQDHTGGSSDDVDTEFTVEGFADVDARGKWTLKVIDDARLDVGTLESWGLSIQGTAI